MPFFTPTAHAFSLLRGTRSSYGMPVLFSRFSHSRDTKKTVMMNYALRLTVMAASWFPDPRMELFTSGKHAPPINPKELSPGLLFSLKVA